jgi:serine/threonine protein kinase
MPLSQGQKIASYEILAPLGAGGMGEVWRARDTRLGREVAIKALPEAFARDPERLARFEREAKLLASVNHANIGAIYGLEVVDGHRYLVLEFLEGETLASLLSRGPLPVAEAIEVCGHVAGALEAAHEAGIVHRDLNPAT